MPDCRNGEGTSAVSRRGVTSVADGNSLMQATLTRYAPSQPGTEDLDLRSPGHGELVNTMENSMVASSVELTEAP